MKEPIAKTIVETYKTMNIPESNIYAFDLESPVGKKAYSNGVINIAYMDKWIELHGIGN